MNKRYINKQLRSKRLRNRESTTSKSKSNTISQTISSSSGLPYTINDSGDYVVDKTLCSNGDIVAFGDSSNQYESNIYLNDIADVDVSTKKNGYVLTYDEYSNRFIFSEPAKGGLESVDWADVKNKPEEYKPEAHIHRFKDIIDNIDAGDF